MFKFKAAVFSALLLLMVGACVPAPLLIGAASGGAVYSVTNDYIKDYFNISKEQAFETMMGIIAQENGEVTSSSIKDGKIVAKIGESNLFIDITPVNDRTIQVVFRAKKRVELLPDKELSVRIYRSFVKAVTK